MSTLVVAPASNINNLADWVSSANGRQLTVLNGMVSVREVLASIASGRYRIIHFATHGCESALTVSDGEIPAHLLEDALRAAGHVELVIIGACASIPVGARLYMAGVPRVLSWRIDVDDRAAVEWAKTFYSSLNLSGDIWDAQVTAGEAVRRLGYEPPIFLNGRMAKLEAELTHMRKRWVAGVPRWLIVLLAVYGAVMLALLARLVL